MAPSILQVLLNIALDESSYKGIDEAVTKLDAKLGGIDNRMKQLSGFAQAAGNGIAQGMNIAEESLRDVLTGTTAVERRLDDLDKKVFKPKIQLDTSQASIAQIDSFFDNLPAASGDKRNRLQKFGSSVRSLPSVQIPGLGVGTDSIANVIRLAGAFTDLTGKTALATRATAALTPLVGTATASFIAMAAPIAAVAAAIGALLLILKSISDAADEAAKAEKKRIEAYKLQVEVDREIAHFMEDGDLEGAKKRYKELLEQQEDANARLTDLYVQKAAIDKEYADLGIQFNLNARSAIAARGKAVQDEIDKIYNEDFTPATQAAEQLAGSMDEITEAAKRSTEANQELLEERAKSVQKLYDLEQERLKAEEEFGRESGEIDDDRRLRDDREEEDFNLKQAKQLKDHKDKLLQIDTEGNEAIEKKRASNDARIDKADKDIQKMYDSLSDVTEDAQKKIGKVNKKYMEDEIEAVEDHIEELKEIDEEGNKERLKILSQLALDLRDAEVANDVIAFVAAKKRAEEQLKTLEDETNAEKEAREKAFQEARDDAEKERLARIAEIEQEAADRRADILEKINDAQMERDELKKVLDQELAEEIQRVADLRAAEIKAYEDRKKEEEEERKLRLKRQEEDDEIADKRRQAQQDRILKDIDERINKEKLNFGIIDAAWRNGITGIATFLTSTVGNAIDGLKSKVQSLANVNLGGSSSVFGPNPPPSNSNPFWWNGAGTNTQNGTINTGDYLGGGVSYTPVAFAKGGIADKPTYGMFGDVPPGWAEGFVPFKKSEGIGPALARLGGTSTGMSGGDTYIVNLNGDISGVTEAFVREELNKSMQTVQVALRKAKQP